MNIVWDVTEVNEYYISMHQRISEWANWIS